jgi:hypothetical protein
MSTLSDALLELRISVLMRIARFKNIKADESIIRQLAANGSDSLVMRKLCSKRAPLEWVLGWFRR